jgi:hypothetical protein
MTPHSHGVCARDSLDRLRRPAIKGSGYAGRRSFGRNRRWRFAGLTPLIAGLGRRR